MSNEHKQRKLKLILKELFATRYGWLSIILANVFWSMFWFPFLVIWFITRENQWLVIATSVYLFFLQPLVPMTFVIIPLTAYFILKNVQKK
jgi:hypothetical protein